MNLITHGTVYPGSVPDFAENPENEQDPGAEQYLTEENQETDTEHELAWDPYEN